MIIFHFSFIIIHKSLNHFSCFLVIVYSQFLITSYLGFSSSFPIGLTVFDVSSVWFALPVVATTA